jgi:RNA polymerase sigma-70 factor (ECF subfamily)
MSLYSTHTDEELLLQLQSGNEAAFTALYDRYWERLLARAVLRLQSTEDAKEVVQDVFIRLWNRRERLTIRNSFHTYIAAALKYEIIRKLNERERVRLESTELTDDGATILKVADDTTQNELDFQDLQQRLQASVKRLPEKCRLVFRLSREKGLSEKEIAETLQISPKTVQGHITHAIKDLRSALNSFLLFFL